MTQKEFEEELVFNQYKDSYIESYKKFRAATKEYENIDAREVYVRINKYQVANYGNSLSGNGLNDFRDYNEYGRKARQRRRYNVNKYGIDNKNSKKNRWRKYE
jgi:hypothetical protein